nr:MAG TPA: hypothetical protein [Caudoviricetes sp.]
MSPSYIDSRNSLPVGLLSLSGSGKLNLSIEWLE